MTSQSVSAPAPPGAVLPRLVFVLVAAAAGWLVVSGLRELQGIVAPLLLTLNLVVVAFCVG